MTGFIERVFTALGQAGVDYLVVGGVAVVLHGHLRTTADLDLVVRLERDNALRAIRTLAGLGFVARAPVNAEAFADAEQRKMWARDKNMQVFSLWHPDRVAFAVDLFLEEPFEFSDAHARGVHVDLGGVDVVVASIPDLIALKRLAGRAQDLADIEALTALQEEDAT